MPWQPDYASTVELRDYLRISDTADDVALASAVGGASRAIDQACNRQFGLLAAPEARYYTGCYDRSLGRWRVDIDDLQTVTGLAVAIDPFDDQSWTGAVTPTAMRPVNAVPNGKPWTYFVTHPTSLNLPTTKEAGVRVTARFGWTTVPGAVKQACLLQASRLFARRDAPFGVAGSIEAGSEMRLLSKIDPDVEVMLRSFRKVWGAV